MKRLASALAAVTLLLGVALASAPSASTSAPARPVASAAVASPANPAPAVANALCPNSPQAWQWSGTTKFGRGWCIKDVYGWKFYFQPGDGNFVVYDYNDRARWQSGIKGDHGFAQSDGNLVLTDAANHVVWQTHTCCHVLASGQLYDAVAIAKQVGPTLYHYNQIHIVNASNGQSVQYLGEMHPPQPQ